MLESNRSCRRSFCLVKHHADETAASSSPTDPGLYCADPVRDLLHGANVHQSRVAVNNSAGSRISHALQHHCAEWLHNNNQGEIRILIRLTSIIDKRAEIS